MSYKVDNGVCQLCGEKTLLNILNKILSALTTGRVGVVVNSLNIRFSGISLLESSRFESQIGFAISANR